MAVFITLIGKNTRWFYTSALSFSLPDYFQMLNAENNIVVRFSDAENNIVVRVIVFRLDFYRLSVSLRSSIKSPLCK
ncbi:hypothetical protein LTSEMIS_4227 [Salmonella enterica subsp. enterica serovar Mississippi str. A4-633]|nr:hypothetical protein LTSEMIS_4227 [Salmonella enterica subsp. enterica serovar Mississippi str. A4-633]